MLAAAGENNTSMGYYHSTNVAVMHFTYEKDVWGTEWRFLLFQRNNHFAETDKTIVINVSLVALLSLQLHYGLQHATFYKYVSHGYGLFHN